MSQKKKFFRTRWAWTPLVIFCAVLIGAGMVMGEETVYWLREKGIITIDPSFLARGETLTLHPNEDYSQGKDQNTETKVKPSAPQVSALVKDNGILIQWNPIEHTDLLGYKIVISKQNRKPAYTGDDSCSGYLAYVTDTAAGYYFIDNKTPYSKGDFGSHLAPGNAYFFSVTAVYSCCNIAGNSISLVFPAQDQVAKPNTQQQNEKIKENPPVDENKTPGEQLAVTGYVSGNTIVLNWQPAQPDNFKFYKIVISKTNPNPRYPEDGFLYCIENRNQTTAVIDNKQAYSGGDITGYLEPGKSYYFSVTYVYHNRNQAGNSVYLTVPADINNPPQQTYAAPQVSHQVGDNWIKLMWQPINDNRLQYYKVVISKSNPNPRYPENGYLDCISATNITIDNRKPYNCGDFGDYLVPGEAYYFNVTAVYKDGTKIPGNAVRITVPVGMNYPPSQPYSTPVVNFNIEGDIIKLNWEKIDDSRLGGYKVVISRYNANPRYHEQGYLYWITDKNRTTATIDNSTPYSCGDFGSYLEPGIAYYFSITAVYNNGTKVPGNAVYITVPAGMPYPR